MLYTNHKTSTTRAKEDTKVGVEGRTVDGTSKRCEWVIPGSPEFKRKDGTQDYLGNDLETNIYIDIDSLSPYIHPLSHQHPYTNPYPSQQPLTHTCERTHIYTWVRVHTLSLSVLLLYYTHLVLTVRSERPLVYKSEMTIMGLWAETPV